MKLVIVESPSKAKTIEKYLGAGFLVRASVGHIRDLPKSNKDAVDVENGFKPLYQIVPAKQKIIDELHEAAERSDEVILATLTSSSCGHRKHAAYSTGFSATTFRALYGRKCATDSRPAAYNPPPCAY